MIFPEIVHIRVAWLEGYDTPIVEMWTREPGGDCNGTASYGYWRVCQPHIGDEDEWLRLRAAAKTTTYVPWEPSP
jgi:hypothetical protein